MKVCATSDLHGTLDGLYFGGCDLAVIAGDIAPLYGFGESHVRYQLDWVNTTFRDFTDSFPKTQFVVIPGNHDFFPIAVDKYGKSRMWKYSFGKNVKFLLDSGFAFKGLKIYGTPRIPIISHAWAFETGYDGLVEAFSKIPYGLDLLISHSPPRFGDVDFSLQTDDGPFGSSELANEIVDKKPRYVFCGHIHSGDHKPTMLGDSTVVNVSRLDERYEIGYDTFEIEIDKKG